MNSSECRYILNVKRVSESFEFIRDQVYSKKMARDNKNFCYLRTRIKFFLVLVFTTLLSSGAIVQSREDLPRNNSPTGFCRTKTGVLFAVWTR